MQALCLAVLLLCGQACAAASAFSSTPRRALRGVQSRFAADPPSSTMPGAGRPCRCLAAPETPAWLSHKSAVASPDCTHPPADLLAADTPASAPGFSQLQPGTVPFSQDQLSCFVAAAAESVAVQTYFDVSALMGLAAIYGNSTGGAFMEELLDEPGVAELLELPLTNVTAEYEDWVEQTMQACGMPQLVDNDGAELTTGERRPACMCMPGGGGWWWWRRPLGGGALAGGRRVAAPGLGQQHQQPCAANMALLAAQMHKRQPAER